MTQTKEALVARGLVKSLGARKVVNGIDLTVSPNTVTALLGASGAGKSTVLRLLAGLESADSGTVQIGDRILSGPKVNIAPEKRNTGLIFQDFALFPHLKAIDNVAFGLKGFSKSARGAEALKWLDRMGLAQRAQSFPHELSGGEQQRVAIARALAPGPDAILMDEPFSGLDPALRDDVADITLSAIRETGVPAVFVSHDANSAMARADTLAIMRSGKLLQTGTAEALFEAPASLDVAAALGPINTFHIDSLPDGLWGTELRPSQILAVRQTAFRIDPTSPCAAQVQHVARVGEEVQLSVRAGHSDFTFRLPHYQRPRVGDQINLSLHPDGAFIFDYDATEIDT